MLNIIPLRKVDRQTVRDMAEAAAANGEPASVNPFPPEDPNHQHWCHDFHEFDMALAGVD
jgi:hypothetical protein